MKSLKPYLLGFLGTLYMCLVIWKVYEIVYWTQLQQYAKGYSDGWAAGYLTNANRAEIENNGRGGVEQSALKRRVGNRDERQPGNRDIQPARAQPIQPVPASPTTSPGGQSRTGAPPARVSHESAPVRTIRRVAREEGVPPEILLAVALWEGRGKIRIMAVGDQGRSYGAFQIRSRLHGVPIKKCRDVEYSARWTAQRLLSFGDVWLGVERHNGAGPQAEEYARNVREIAEGL